MARVYREIRQTRVRGDNDGVDAPETAGAAMVLLARVVYLIAGIIIGLLVLRFILALLGANPDNTFANFVYTASNPFASPFFGLFDYKTQYGIARFEFETLIAIVVYAIVAWLLIRLFTLGNRRYDEE